MCPSLLISLREEEATIVLLLFSVCTSSASKELVILKSNMLTVSVLSIPWKPLSCELMLFFDTNKDLQRFGSLRRFCMACWFCQLVLLSAETIYEVWRIDRNQTNRILRRNQCKMHFSKQNSLDDQGTLKIHYFFIFRRGPQIQSGSTPRYSP